MNGRQPTRLTLRAHRRAERRHARTAAACALGAFVLAFAWAVTAGVMSAVALLGSFGLLVAMIVALGEWAHQRDRRRTFESQTALRRYVE